MARRTRREFLEDSMFATAAAVAANAAPNLFADEEKQSKSPNETLGVAVVGVNGRGNSHIAGWLEQPNVEIVYLIDPDQKVLDGTLKSLEQKAAGRFTTKGVADVRKALEDPTLDAISIATPNHWHSLMTIWAAQAGKHVYVEKPMSHDVAEGRAAVAAQRKYGVVVQQDCVTGPPRVPGGTPTKSCVDRPASWVTTSDFYTGLAVIQAAPGPRAYER